MAVGLGDTRTSGLTSNTVKHSKRCRLQRPPKSPSDCSKSLSKGHSLKLNLPELNSNQCLIAITNNITMSMFAFTFTQKHLHSCLSNKLPYQIINYCIVCNSSIIYLYQIPFFLNNVIYQLPKFFRVPCVNKVGIMGKAIDLRPYPSPW